MILWHYITWTLSFTLLYTVADSDTEPLKLTPYLEAGKVEEAQAKALITPNFGGVKSYSGFFTVNKECDSNHFFWFFPAKNNWETAPVILWVSSKTATSALIGLFIDIGPYNHHKKEGFIEREYPWTIDHNVIFLDKPVGSGFSYTKKESCYPKTLKDASQDVYVSLTQFFTLFPNLQKNKFFMVGQDIGAHYIAGIASQIDSRNEKAEVKINLVGLWLGNPSIDKTCQFYSSYEYQLGIADERLRDEYKEVEQNYSKLINENKVNEAVAAIDAGPGNPMGLPSYRNILYDSEEVYDFQPYIRNYKTREQIHVGNAPYDLYGDRVYYGIINDTYIPVTSYIEQLLKTNKYTIGFISGQLSTRMPPTFVPCFLHKIKCFDYDEYYKANRSLWYVGDRLAGWFKTVGNVFEVVVRNSGEDVARDQPYAALDLITAAVASSPGGKLLTKLQTKLPDDTA